MGITLTQSPLTDNFSIGTLELAFFVKFFYNDIVKNSDKLFNV